MSTKEKLGPFDALEKALPQEPMFPILARDPCGPATITEWARLRRNRAFRLWGSSRAADKKLLDAELAQCAQAELIAEQMDDWRNKEQDEQVVERSSYNEVKKTEEELREAAQRQVKEELCKHLREAAYHLCEARDGMHRLGLIGDVTFNDMTTALARINGIADEHQEVRPRYAPQPALPLEQSQ